MNCSFSHGDNNGGEWDAQRERAFTRTCARERASACGTTVTSFGERAACLVGFALCKKNVH